MIADYKLLTDIDIFFKKKFIIWGAGKRGKELAQDMSMHTKQIEFVDTDKMKAGNYCGIPVCQPEKIIGYRWEKYAIVLSPDDVQLQESILEQIKQMGLWEGVDIYTKYAVRAALAFINHKNKISSDQKTDKLIKSINELSSVQKMQTQLIMTMLAEKSVFVYQSKKVGSSSITGSVSSFGVYAFHVHNFEIPNLDTAFIRDLIKKGSGKVISIVREPIARQISLLWHYWAINGVYINYNSLEEIEKYFYAIPNEEDEFTWYLKEFQKILDINIYEYPFEKARGYSIIEKKGISLLLLKMEKLNELGQVIGDFLGIENFQLKEFNAASNKPYKYAYQNYLENVKIPSEFFEYYYSNNKYMDYFYTEEEKNIFRERWKNHISNIGLLD